MGDHFDCIASNLLCSENTTTCFDDFNYGNVTNENSLLLQNQNLQTQTQTQNPIFDSNRSKPLIGLAIQAEDSFEVLFGKKMEHLPRDDHQKRLRSEELELAIRREDLDWIWKASSHYGFNPLCVFLSLSYLDHFLSVYELPRGKT